MRHGVAMITASRVRMPGVVRTERMGKLDLALSKEGTRAKPAVATRNAKSSRKGNKEVGQALRSVYDQTVDEDVPPEMLDLLGKLS